jgi:hypothetical protein
MRIGTWNFRNLNGAGSLLAAARELARYISDVVGVQEVGWDKAGRARAWDFNIFYGKESESHQLGI